MKKALNNNKNSTKFEVTCLYFWINTFSHEEVCNYKNYNTRFFFL